MKRSERYEAVLRHFAEVSPHVTTELEFGSVFQLLVATVLSAQCTDKRVNQVTPELFRHYPDAALALLLSARVQPDTPAAAAAQTG